MVHRLQAAVLSLRYTETAAGLKVSGLSGVERFQGGSGGHGVDELLVAGLSFL